MRTISAEKFDRVAGERADISDYLDWSALRLYDKGTAESSKPASHFGD
jgi:hypothetical protein